MDGRNKCKILRGIRQRIADINGIIYEPYPCSINNNDCKGTCPQCDKEVEWLYTQLKLKESQGYQIFVTPNDLDEYEFRNNEKRDEVSTI